MKKLRTLLVDDEPLMCQELTLLLQDYPDIELIGSYHDSQTAVAKIIELQPDLIFLDIKMSGQTGLQIAKQLAHLPVVPLLVFATAYQNFAIDAFSVNAIDYILKPFDEHDIARAIQKIRRYTGQLERNPAECLQPVRKISAQSGNRLEIIDQSAIQLVYTKERAVFIQTMDGRTLTGKMTLLEYEQVLQPGLFCRCHRSYIINVQAIVQLAPWFNRGYIVTLRGTRPQEVPVSKRYVKHLKNFIQF